MNGLINDSINYNGQVNVKFRIGDKVVSKKIHNQGTMQLKRAFAMFMCGGQVAQEALRYVPTRLDLRYSQEASWLNPQSYLNRSVLITSPAYAKEDLVGLNAEKSWYVEYTAIIPYSSLISQINPSYYYRLYLTCDGKGDTDDSKDIAYIDVDAEDLTGLEAGVSIIITWRMKLLNSVPEE